jgi:cephalosporin-C deacetylase-like acetyl esterase
MRHSWLASWVIMTGLATQLVAAPVMRVTADHETGVYRNGESATWTVQVTEEKQPVQNGEIEYRVLNGGATQVQSGKAPLKNGTATVTAQRADAGCVLLTVKYTPAGSEQPVTAQGGAVFNPEQIQASAPVPEDFDEFWKAKIAELHAVPMNVQLKKMDSGHPGVEYFQITFDNIHGRKIRGQLARPVGKTSLPAMLQVQWAGVYPLQPAWVIGPARNGWLALNISAHDLPIDEPKAFYDAQAANELKDYRTQGSRDREHSYFLPMFLGCFRAVDYLTECPEWNQKTLLVQGTSQGGYQALVTAGMHPRITAMSANVPAGCDHTGKAAGRSPGWPNWVSASAAGEETKQALRTARYFDAMNFATRITCPALVGVGLVDTTCPPEGVMAAYQQIQGPKKLVIMPHASHKDHHEPWGPAFAQFLKQQQTGTASGQ